MLRHLKMKRQKDNEPADEQATAMSQQIFTTGLAAKPEALITGKLQSNLQQQMKEQRRTRGRRSSKPQMEKRRRARINQCLDTLKSYVLTDATANLSRFGIDVSASENRDEETIARTILKSSGLINRHRGRKNPNKLEKADILELTVDYVRRLHEQRDEWLALACQQQRYQPRQQPISHSAQLQASRQHSPHTLSPLSLNLASIATVPVTPPPSSASSSPQPLLSISANRGQPSSSLDVLDLSDKRVKMTTACQERQQEQHVHAQYKQGAYLVDGVWRTPTTSPTNVRC